MHAANLLGRAPLGYFFLYMNSHMQQIQLFFSTTSYTAATPVGFQRKPTFPEQGYKMNKNVYRTLTALRDSFRFICWLLLFYLFGHACVCFLNLIPAFTILSL